MKTSTNDTAFINKALKVIQAMPIEELEKLYQKHLEKKGKQESETREVKHTYECNFCGSSFTTFHEVKFGGRGIKSSLATPNAQNLVLHGVTIRTNWCPQCKEVMKEREQEFIIDNALKVIRKLEKTYFGV